MLKRALCTLGLVGFCLLLAGCSKGYSGDGRFPLSGKVTVDGQPVDFGSISFLPLEGQRVSGGLITDGTYTVPDEQGANAGKYRIEIRWNKPTGKMVMDPVGEVMVEERREGVPAKYNTDSELTVEVSPKQTTFDFDLKSN